MPAYQRYSRTPKTIYQNKETYGVWQKPEFLTTELSKDLIFTFSVTSEYAGRPDNISYYVYGTPYYDWAIIAFNGVTDTLNWPKVGTIIRYPSKSALSGV